MRPSGSALSSHAAIAPVERHDTLADRAYQQLRHAIMSGSFQPGQKITIRNMAAVLGVSTTPAREAINRLVTERVLDAGAFRAVSVPRLDAARLAEIYAMRIALEGLAAEVGASNIGPDDIEKLERIQLALIGAMDRGDYRTVLIENEAFHFTIYRAAAMPMLLDAIQQLWLKLGPSLNLLYPSYNRSRKGVGHHLTIIQALRDADSTAARRGMEGDIRDGGAELQQAVIDAAGAANDKITFPRIVRRQGGRSTTR